MLLVVPLHHLKETVFEFFPPDLPAQGSHPVQHAGAVVAESPLNSAKLPVSVFKSLVHLKHKLHSHQEICELELGCVLHCVRSDHVVVQDGVP